MTGWGRTVTERRQYASACDAVEMIGGLAVTSSVHTTPGIVAAIVPACDHPQVNVALAGPDLTADDLRRLDEIDADAGIRRRSVWAWGGDGAADLLIDRGYICGEVLPAMERSLVGTRPHRPDPTYIADTDMPTVGEVNSATYGVALGPAFAGALGSHGARARAYQARSGGRAASVLCAIWHDHGAAAGSDVGISWVATREGHQRQGHARRLLSDVLARAGQTGATTSSLQASVRGTRLYAGLGYVPVGTFSVYYRPVK